MKSGFLVLSVSWISNFISAKRNEGLMLRRALASVLAFSVVVYAQGNTFNRVRYNGGTVSTKVDPQDWGNRLTITSDLIEFKLKDSQKIDIQPKLVTTLSYGQEAHRRVGTMIALGILVAPLALFGLFHKTRLHFIGIEYTSPDGKKGGLLMQGDKDNYRAILVALQSVTGVPVSVAEREREFIPVGVKTDVAKQPAQEQTLQTVQTSPTEQIATVQVNSTPDGADIYLDGAFVGNAPSTLKISVGKHVIKVTSDGYREWSREIAAQSGSQLKLNATLPIASVAPTQTSKPPADSRAIKKTLVEPASQLATIPQQAGNPSKLTTVPQPVALGSSENLGSVSITSSPADAEIFIDSIGQGHTPTILKVPAGRHSVQLVMKDYKDWTSTILVHADSVVNVTATLENKP